MLAGKGLAGKVQNEKLIHLFRCQAPKASGQSKKNFQRLKILFPSKGFEKAIGHNVQLKIVGPLCSLSKQMISRRNHKRKD